MTKTILRSDEVIQNLIANRGFDRSALAYAYAFGTAWAMLNEKQRLEVIKMSEQKVGK